MDLEGLNELLQETGYAVAYDEFEEGENPELPWIAYYELNSDNFQADDSVFLNIKDVRIELYTERKDVKVERKLESLLNENGLVFNSYDEPIDDEDLYLHAIETRIWY